MEGQPPTALHGFDLDPADERLLRAHPSAQVLRWCEAAVGDGAEVIGVAALEGGTASAVHAVDVRDGGEGVHPLVLRRFVRAEWLAGEPDAAAREATALEIAGRCPVLTPRLVALDPHGQATDVPAVLMTRLAGSVQWRPPDLDGFLRHLAAAIPEIHATPVHSEVTLPAYAPYDLCVDRPPSWSTRPEIWRRAFDAFAAPPPTEERRFIHRDFHPGNVLWRGGVLTGVVDWSSASIGPPSADVGHCRFNLAAAIGLDAADRFLARCREVTGGDDHHPYWDIVAALGGVDEDDWTPRDEDFLARAVDRL